MIIPILGLRVEEGGEGEGEGSANIVYYWYI
jgi:hypothetical protein